jgi:putative ABC transport system permease protein
MTRSGTVRRHIAGQFLIESSVTGLLGGLIGAALGMVAVLAVSVATQWTPILDVRFALMAPLIGGYPAIKAGTIEPITALRRAG